MRADVMKAPGCRDEEEECIHLIVLPYSKKIPISLLSDECFKKEECEELYQIIKADPAWRPTVMDLQHKAQMLHKVITKQWLAKELSLIRSLIDRDNETGWCATEKGWRKELFEYLERIMLEQKRAGQEGILLSVPNVIADPEPESSVQNSAEAEKNNMCCSPMLTIAGITGAEQEGILLPVPNVIAEDIEPESSVQKSAEAEMNDISCSPIPTIVGITGARAVIDEGNTRNTSVKEANGVGNKSKEPVIIDISNDDDQQGVDKSKEPVIIDISNDDDQQGVDDPDIAQWYYEDCEKVTRGPFSARSLKGWKGEGFFKPGFKVWKLCQPPVLLNNMLSRMYPNWRG